MRARSPICLLLICLLTISLLALHVPQAWAWDWTLVRPDRDVDFEDERIDGANTDEKASVGLGLHVTEYHENSLSAPFEGSDGLTVRAVATGNTRKIVDYTLSRDDDDYYWHDDLPVSLNIWGDNSFDWIDALGEFGYKFRFYGGAGSAEYGLIWVSSNGVIFFNDTNTDPSYSAPIPNRTDPDNFIAPFWRDLKPNLGGSITYGTVQHPSFNPVYCLAISWNDVPDVNGNNQTFQVILEPAPTGLPHNSANYWQSRIWFQYKSITLDEPTTVGIEDQLGERGNYYNYLDLSNEATLEIARYGNYAAITSLTIEMIENDAYAFVDIIEDSDYYRGENVDLQPAPGDGDSEKKYWMALAGGAVLLLELAPDPSGISKAAGFMLGTTLWFVEVADTLAASAKKAEVMTNDTQPDGVPNYALAPAYESNYQSFPVDAWFGIQFHWVLTDPNNQPHTLTVRTKLKYDEYTKYGSLIDTGEITTSKTLHVEPAQHTLSISTTAGGTTDPAPGTHNYTFGTSVPVTAIPDTRYLFDYWLLDGATAYDNPITVTMDSDHDLSAHFTFINNPPNIPSRPEGPPYGNTGISYTYNTSATDPDGDDLSFTFDWGDSSTNTTGLYPSGANASASHTWTSWGKYNVTVKAIDQFGASSNWSQKLTVNIEPSLATTLNHLGFTNIQESSDETFSAGVYEVKLYAEFAGYHEFNNLSWYPIETTSYNLIFNGSDGNHGYVDPPVTRTFTTNGEFGLSMATPENHRYFTETAENPDGLKHAQVYADLDNPDMFLIGFENLFGIENEDYNDMVISLEIVNRPPDPPSTPSGYPSGIAGVSYNYSTSTNDVDGDEVSYTFDWGDGSSTTIGPYPPNVTVSASHAWTYAGSYNVTVKAKDSIELWSDPSPPLTVTINNPPPGGCPTLFVWNGTAYLDFGVIDIHNPENQDLTKEVPLPTESVAVNNYIAKFRLREGWEGLTYSHSEIDQVELYAVIDGNRYLCPLVYANHSEQGGVTSQLLFSDDWKVDTYLLETVNLYFFIPYENVEAFVFVIEGHNPLKK